MRIGDVLPLLLATAIPRLAIADMPIDAGTLGHLEAVVDFCSRIDPRGAENYQDKIRSVTASASEADIAQARKTQEYQQARETIGEELGKIPQEQAGEACAAALESKG